MSSDPAAEHNERIAAKRKRVCLDFIETTSTNLRTAKHYCQMSSYDLERAISLFYDVGNGQALPPTKVEEGGEVEESQDPNVLSDNTDYDEDEDDDPISSIMKSVKREAPTPSATATPDSSFFTGRGFSLKNSSSNNNSASRDDNDDSEDEEESNEIRVKVIFYKDGFTAQEEEVEQAQGKQDSNTNEIRRRGIHSLSSSSTSKNNSQVEQIPPLRDYKSNQEFIDNIQKSQVPVEFRRFDNKKSKRGRRRPIPVTILLSDRRPHLYPMKQYQAQQEQLENQKSLTMKAFHGTGQTLGVGGNSGSRTRSGTSIQQQQQQRDINNRNHATNHIISWMLDILKSWWNWILNLFLSSLSGRRRNPTSPPIMKHTIDPALPTTTVSLRFPSSIEKQQQLQRQRVVFNTNHTVSDLYTYCSIELQERKAKSTTAAHAAAADGGRRISKQSLARIPPPEFELLSGFPPRLLPKNTSISKEEENDDTLVVTASSTLEEAKLCNAVVEVRIISTLDDKRQN